MLSWIRKACSLLLAVGMAVSCSLPAAAEGTEEEEFPVMANTTTKIFVMYNKGYSDFMKMAEEAELIMVGKVESFTGVEDRSIVNTEYTVKTYQVIKNPNNYDTSNVIVQRLGGYYLDKDRKLRHAVVEGAPEIQQDTYLFLLNKIYSEDDTSNLYSLCGMQQGVFQLDIPQGTEYSQEKVDSAKFIVFNSYNDGVEAQIVGRTLRSVREALQGGTSLDGKPFSRDYLSLAEDFQTLADQAELIAVATVGPIRYWNYTGRVFSGYDLTIKNVIKNVGDYDTGNIRFRFSLGKNTDNLQYGPETPTLKEGETYLFLGSKVFPYDQSSNLFQPCGKYQGVFKLFAPGNGPNKIVSLKKYTIERMNHYNQIEEETAGKSLAALLESLEP